MSKSLPQAYIEYVKENLSKAIKDFKNVPKRCTGLCEGVKTLIAKANDILQQNNPFSEVIQAGN